MLVSLLAVVHLDKWIWGLTDKTLEPLYLCSNLGASICPLCDFSQDMWPSYCLRVPLYHWGNDSSDLNRLLWWLHEATSVERPEQGPPCRKPWKLQQWPSMIQPRGEDTRLCIPLFWIPALDKLCKLALHVVSYPPPIAPGDYTITHAAPQMRDTRCTPTCIPQPKLLILQNCSDISFSRRTCLVEELPWFLGVHCIFQHPESTSTKALSRDPICALFSLPLLCTS